MNRNISIKIGAASMLALLVLGALLWLLPGEAQGVSELLMATEDESNPGLTGLEGARIENTFQGGLPVGPDESSHSQIIARTDAVLMRLTESSTTIAVLNNDVYLVGDRANLSVSAITQPGHGQATILSDNSVEYTPNDGFIGRDSFHYTISDGTLSSEGRVWVTVPDPNAPRWEVTWTNAVDEGGSTTLQVLQTNPDVTVDEERQIGVTLHVGLVESTGDTDDIIVRDGCCDILPDYPFTRNIHHDGARVYIVGSKVGDAKRAAMTIEAIDDSDGEETLALWSYVNGYLAGSGTLTIRVP